MLLDMLLERRKDKRFHLKGSAFATLGPHFATLGEIKDISRGGLAFCHIAGGQGPNISVELERFLYIFLSDISFCLLGLPIKPISDFEIKNQIAFNPTRRCSVKFGAITDDQKSELEYFIRNYCVCEAEETINRNNWKAEKTWSKNILQNAG